MKKIKNIFLYTTVLLTTAACGKETPFSSEEISGEGKFLSSSIAVDLKTEENLVRSEASGVPDVGEFTVSFFDTASSSEEPVRSYKYKEMPEVVTLPVGNYKVRAWFGGEYGDGNNAKFDAPYYMGESANFAVEKDKIVDSVDPIVCRLANVKVTILFDEHLVKSSGDDLKVSVKVGESGSLDFTPRTSQSGFFKYVEGSSTLAAEFSGTVEDLPTREVKTYDNVKPGNHYRITFKLHSVDPNEPGNIDPDDPDNPINIDANVEYVDMAGDPVNPSFNEEYLEDDRYPDEGPGNNDDPVDPKPGAGPEITAEAPIDLDKLNEVNAESKCVLNVKSETGITGFLVVIDSNTLTPEELKGVELSDKLDLVNPGALEEKLKGLGLPVGAEVLNQKAVRFDISGFMPLLGLLGEGTHKFTLTVSDSNGSTSKTLQLHNLGAE